MKKTLKILVLFIVLIIAAGGGFYVINQPPSIERLKVHPEDFRFEYFERNMEMQKALEATIPLGMTEERVDEILVHHIGARKSNFRGQVDYESYHKDNLFIKFMRGINSGFPDYIVTIFYDSNRRVKKICAFGSHCPFNKKG